MDVHHLRDSIFNIVLSHESMQQSTDGLTF